MNLHEWAARWNIPAQAFAELVQVSVIADEQVGERSEAYVQSAVRLEAASKGVYLWRNQVGAGVVVDTKALCPECHTRARRPIRWGLANDSKKLNDVIKSGDLIGARPIQITASMVGSTIAQFVSRECKREDWHYAGSVHDVAQLSWATLINSIGGDAAIVNAVGSL